MSPQSLMCVEGDWIRGHYIHKWINPLISSAAQCALRVGLVEGEQYGLDLEGSNNLVPSLPFSLCFLDALC